MASIAVPSLIKPSDHAIVTALTFCSAMHFLLVLMRVPALAQPAP
ncbi:hypothetical protein [Saccharothrix sp. S26]|nr:hypothetical protein [Saccharothrix sp. S26]